MFGKRYKLFRLSGFEVGIDLSWLILAVLIAWSLSMGYFPYEFKGYTSAIYWVMGILSALGLFMSIVVHEFTHSAVARAFGMKMKGITLFIFGGVAEMGDEPPSAKAEFLMALAGPLSSAALAVVLYGFFRLGAALQWPIIFTGVAVYLSFINIVLAVFNMIPAFPLDGGRVLRSILWKIKKDLRWATLVSARIGSGFGIFLIILGIARFLFGNFIGGMWMFLIGLFLQGAARASLQQLLTRDALAGEPLQRFMNTNPVTVPPSMPLDQVVDDYIYKFRYELLPVVESGRLVGCVTSRQISTISKDQWHRTPVGAILRPCSEENIISTREDAVKALEKMRKSEANRLMVVDDGHLAGVIALQDMLQFLSQKAELEQRKH